LPDDDTNSPGLLLFTVSGHDALRVSAKDESREEQDMNAKKLALFGGSAVIVAGGLLYALGVYPPASGRAGQGAIGQRQVYRAEQPADASVTPGAAPVAMEATAQELKNHPAPKLQNGQIFQLNTGQLYQMNNGQMLQMKNGQMLQMKNGQMLQLQNGQFYLMKNGQMLALRNGQMYQLSTGQMLQMNNGQMLALRNGQMLALRNGQMLALSNGQLLAMKNGQMLALNNGQIQAMMKQPPLLMEQRRTFSGDPP
jgi:co-chaperonin GroES (HSP10)